MYYYNINSPSDAASYAYMVMLKKKPPEEVCSCPQKMNTWAKTIASSYRRREFTFAKRTVSFDISKHDKQVESEEASINSKLLIQTCLGILTKCEREAVDLHHIEELTIEETAEKLRISINSVKSRLKNAFERIRNAFPEEMPPSRAMPKSKK